MDQNVALLMPGHYVACARERHWLARPLHVYGVGGKTSTKSRQYEHTLLLMMGRVRHSPLLHYGNYPIHMRAHGQVRSHRLSWLYNGDDVLVSMLATSWPQLQSWLVRSAEVEGKQMHLQIFKVAARLSSKRVSSLTGRPSHWTSNTGLTPHLFAEGVRPL